MPVTMMMSGYDISCQLLVPRPTVSIVRVALQVDHHYQD